MIRAEGVCISYGPRKILEEINFEAAAGEFFCVLGPNGSGKTTLMKRICGFLDGEGSITINGRSLKDFRRTEIARMVAVVPQRSALTGGLTVRETVELGCYAAHRQSAQPGPCGGVIEKVIKILNLQSCADRDVASLSGGEFQKVLLARALAQESRILILDEATAHLDIHHALEIFSLVKNLTRTDGLTVLAVVHDINLAAAFADRIMILNKGRCAGIQTPEKILTPRMLEDVFRITAEILRTAGGHIAVAPRLTEKSSWN
ncbi:MAG: ABC transporter ATP-binding protein [Spirochaetales bacterium]|jgi:iron complex transport system ATP-binding protein|nr:ABC transporter ATP-binding protein [Spirochaetales bacterium]